MKISAVPDYDVMSQMGADIIFDVIAPNCSPENPAISVLPPAIP
jgi:hypothetical protein